MKVQYAGPKRLPYSVEMTDVYHVITRGGFLWLKKKIRSAYWKEDWKDWGWCWLDGGGKIADVTTRIALSEALYAMEGER